MTVATGISQTALVGLLATNHELVATVLRMREARSTWQQIATATRRHPATCRDIGLAKGMPLCLPGRQYGGTRVDWERNRVEATVVIDMRRATLPAGSPET